MPYPAARCEFGRETINREIVEMRSFWDAFSNERVDGIIFWPAMIGVITIFTLIAFTLK